MITTFAAATFDAFVDTLEPWKRDLLSHLTLELDPRAVIYGSVLSTGNASYRWILSTQRGDRIAEGMGPARGCQVHSYRAKACGILSFLRFLIRIGNLTQIHEQWQGILATDSQSVLDTLFGRDRIDRDEALQ
jgi:hypothetical protein